MKNQVLSRLFCINKNIKQYRLYAPKAFISNTKLLHLLWIFLCYALTSCTKENNDKIYPIGTRFDYAVGSLHDLIQQGSTPDDPFVIDSITPDAYGSSIGYYVTSANGMHYTMSDCDIKVVQ